MLKLKSVVLVGLLTILISAAEPNPPTWPESVKIIDPADPTSGQAAVDAIYAQNGGHVPDDNGQWSEGRYALFFLPGSHAVDVNVGYYTSVYGLGKLPSETKIQSVTSENGSYNPDIGALNNFWRSAENFETTSTKTWNSHVTTLWAVSQAAPLRRAIINGNLDLYQYNQGTYAGFASGGFMADVTISGDVYWGSQQQFLARNAEMTAAHDGSWNMVYVGSKGAPGSSCSDSGSKSITTIASTPLIAEKPFISTDGSKYYLQVPKLESNKEGVSSNYENTQQIDFSQVYVATASDSAATINQKLAQKLHLVLTPGIYNLEESIMVNHPNTVVLGLGMATLISANGKPAIQVGNVDGVRIAGILLQAGPKTTEALLLWGSGYSGRQSNPGILSDVFARVGGTNNPDKQEMTVDVMVKINNGNIIYDNSWFWRADHGDSGLVYNSMNPVQSGIQVNGDNVIAYGLASEHTLGNLVEWNGNNGRVYFYQSEYPYDVSQENYADKGYVSYKVGDRVTSHHGFGIGAYSYFRDNEVDMKAGIKAPAKKGISFVSSLTVFLNGKGQIDHVIDAAGKAVSSNGDTAYVCNFNADTL